MRKLDHYQRYLLEEFAEEYLARRWTRRELLRRSLLATGSVTLTAASLIALGCGSDDEPEMAATAPAHSSTAASEASPEADPTAAATGAAPPASAGEEIEAASTTYPGPAGDVLAYLAQPASEGPFAAVIVIHENRGLLPHFEDVARRYAMEGFVALAPDLASRLGGSEVAAARLGQIPAADLVADLLAGLDFLIAQPYVRADALGVTGFCFGGGLTFDLAAASSDVNAAVPYYGTATRALENGLARTQAAVQVHYGADDSRITRERDTVDAALQMTGAPYEIVVHDEAGHAFFNDAGGSYNQRAAEDAWAATLAWFREHLGG